MLLLGPVNELYQSKRNSLEAGRVAFKKSFLKDINSADLRTKLKLKKGLNNDKKKFQLVQSLL